MSAKGESWAVWEPRLRALCDEIRTATRARLMAAARGRTLTELARPVGEGVGDVTYALDAPAEAAIARWLEQTAARAPLSLLTEDTGWRHLGPGKTGTRELDGFDHGGARVAIDPVDGTRNLMHDLRSAWTIVSFAPPGAEEPRLSDLDAGLVAELPDSRAARYRVLSAQRGAPCWFEERTLEDDTPIERRELRADADDRVDHGFFPFFRYMPDLRVASAQLEADFFGRLATHEGAEVRNCYDDQYITNGGQLVLLALGAYRMIVDPRAMLAERRGRPTVTSKPYDMAGAIVCARAAGCALTAVDGGVLDFPIDASTPVSFVGYANEATRARLEPHWLAIG